MMTPETYKRVCALLESMPSTVPWSAEMGSLYAAGLQPFPEYVISDALSRAVSMFSERPSVEDLRRVAGEMMNGPVPSPAASWEEVSRLLSARGIYCAPDPFKPNIFREGEPRFSHPLIDAIVKQMGGWRAVCTDELGVEYLRARFLSLYAELVDKSNPMHDETEHMPAARERRRRRTLVGGIRR